MYQCAAGSRALELLLGSEAGYVRDIVTEELAKGLDAYWRLSADDALDAVRANLVTLLRVRPPASFHLPSLLTNPLLAKCSLRFVLEANIER